MLRCTPTIRPLWRVRAPRAPAAAAPTRSPRTPRAYRIRACDFFLCVGFNLFIAFGHVKLYVWISRPTLYSSHSHGSLMSRGPLKLHRRDRHVTITVLLEEATLYAKRGEVRRGRRSRRVSAAGVLAVAEAAASPLTAHPCYGISRPPSFARCPAPGPAGPRLRCPSSQAAAARRPPTAASPTAPGHPGLPRPPACGKNI